jgi:hypothetical protein
MKNFNIEKLVIDLLKNFPKFVRKMQPDDLQPFMLFGDFGIYIRDIIDSSACDMIELDEIFSFLNEMGESDDDLVHNLLTVGVLEIITDSKKATRIAKKNLKGQALSDLELIEKFWYEK